VIAIIATLIGLLLPAVQSAREAARRTGCRFNIRGLTQAIQVYESNRRRLPAATDRNEAQSRVGQWAAAPTASGYSWIFHILPYMEEGAFYNNVSTNTGRLQLGPFSVGRTAGPTAGGAWSGQNCQGSHAAAVVISQLICPSSGGGSTVETTATGPTNGLSWAQEYATFEPQIGGERVAATNYKAMAGTHIAPQSVIVPPSTTPTQVPLPVLNGAIQFAPDQAVPSAMLNTAWNATRAGVAQSGVTDGMSKSVLVAESKERGYASWIDGTAAWVVAYDPNVGIPFNVNGSWATGAGGTPVITRSALSVQPALSPLVRFLPSGLFGGRMSQGMAFGPSSDHQGGITMHAFGDTHVAPVTADVDPNVYMSICSRNGNEAATLQE